MRVAKSLREKNLHGTGLLKVKKQGTNGLIETNRLVMLRRSKYALATRAKEGIQNIRGQNSGTRLAAKLRSGGEIPSNNREGDGKN